MSHPRLLLFTALLTFAAGCAVPDSGSPSAHPTHGEKLPGRDKWVPHRDSRLGFSLLLPAGVKRGAVDDTEAPMIFTGFALPRGTNLTQKTLVIATGAYDSLTAATPLASFTVHGTVFQRARLDDGSAGHSTLHLIYTTTLRGRQIHFDFTHRAANLADFDPAHRPRAYNQAAQIRLTEETMSTFRPIRGE